MRVITTDNVICVDIDNTLISWERAGESMPHPECKPIEIEFDGRSGVYWVFPFNVESLITHHMKGHAIVVWSGSGHEWAEAVVKALKLEDYVTYVMAKPRWLLDDSHPHEFLPTPYWGAGDPGKTKLK